MHTRKLLACVLLLLAGNVFGQRINPLQTGTYIPTLAGLRDYSSLPEGLYFINYSFWGRSGDFFDKNGNKLTDISIDLPGIVPGIDNGVIGIEAAADAYLNSLLLFYTSRELPKLGNAKYAFNLSPTFQQVKYKATLIIEGDTLTDQGGTAGYGDLSVQPIGLMWALRDRWDISFFYTVYLPTSRYQTGQDNNQGTGHITHQFQVPVLYYLAEKTTAFMVMPTLELNGELVDRDLKPGNRVSLEYGISQYLTNWLEIELMNGHNWQASNDSGADAWYLKTALDVKDRKNSFSAGISASVFENRVLFRFKYIQDYNARQRYINRFFNFTIFFDPYILNEN